MDTIRKGSKGDAVRQLQELLGITVDGIFGPITKAAVKEYQTANGLKADGIVGPLTWAALLGEEGQAAVTVPSHIQPVDCKQYDKRWAAHIYSSHGDKKQQYFRPEELPGYWRIRYCQYGQRLLDQRGTLHMPLEV